MSATKKLAVTLLSLSIAGTAAIRGFEGSSNVAYKDIVGVPTICVGHTKGVKLGDRATDAQCDEFLLQDARQAQRDIQRCVRVPVTQGQFDMLTSLAFNVGGGTVCRSRIVRYINAGNCHAAADAFTLYVYADGKYSRGLYNRRVKEAAVFREGCKQ